MTRKELFENLLVLVKESEVENSEELIAGLEHEIEMVSKKRKTSTVNDGLAEEIYNIMVEVGEPISATDIYNRARDIEGITSSQKVSALLKILVAAHRVDKKKEKKITYYFTI